MLYLRLMLQRILNTEMFMIFWNFDTKYSKIRKDKVTLSEKFLQADYDNVRAYHLFRNLNEFISLY